jgi:hypothetical protein
MYNCRVFACGPICWREFLRLEKEVEILVPPPTGSPFAIQHNDCSNRPIVSLQLRRFL